MGGKIFGVKWENRATEIRSIQASFGKCQPIQRSKSNQAMRGKVEMLRPQIIKASAGHQDFVTWLNRMAGKTCQDNTVLH